jgi:hypothetical protein
MEAAAIMDVIAAKRLAPADTIARHKLRITSIASMLVGLIKKFS